MPFVAASTAVYKRRKPKWQDRPAQRPALASAYRIAAQNERRFINVWQRLWRDMRDPQHLAALRRAIRRRGPKDIAGIAAVLPWFDPQRPDAGPFGSALRGYRRAMSRVVEASGKSAARRGVELPDDVATAVAKARVQYSFDLDNPFTQGWIDSHAGDLITNISTQQQARVQEILGRGFDQGLTVDQMTAEISEFMPLTPQQEAAVINGARRTTIERGWVGMADDMERTGYNPALPISHPDNAAFAALVEERRLAGGITTRLGATAELRRATTIARTETIMAEAAGLEMSWDQAREQGILTRGVEKEWIASAVSLRTCKICRGLHGQRVPVGEAFNSAFIGSVQRPPSHPNCRCTMGLQYPGVT